MVLLKNCREADPDIGIFHRLRLKALFSVGPLETDEASQGIGKLSDKQDLSLDDVFVGVLSLVADNPAGPVVSLIVDSSRQDPAVSGRMAQPSVKLPVFKIANGALLGTR